MSSRATLIAAGTGAAVAAGVVGGATAATRRWAAAHDPTDGEPLCLPEGAEEEIATPDGGRLSATVAGDGERTFLLAHGWTQDRRVWGAVARRLVGRGHRVVLYDHRGHGRSEPGDDGLSLEVLAADMAAVLDHVDARRAVVAGHSMGGMTAQALAVSRPDAVRRRVEALVLVATACDGLGQGDFADRLACRVIGSRLVDRVAGRRHVGPFLMRNSVGRRPALAHLHSARETLVATDPLVRARFLAAMQRMDFAEALAAVDVPVTVVCGTHDRLTPPARSRRLAEVVPNAELETIPDAGHMLPWEVPDRLTDLLERAAGGPDVDLRAGAQDRADRRPASAAATSGASSGSRRNTRTG